jgi:hypothetical protein
MLQPPGELIQSDGKVNWIWTKKSGLLLIISIDFDVVPRHRSKNNSHQKPAEEQICFSKSFERECIRATTIKKLPAPMNNIN